MCETQTEEKQPEEQPKQAEAISAEPAVTDGDASPPVPVENGKNGKRKIKFTKPTKKQVLHEIATWLLMTAGTLLVAAGVYFFKAPNHFATGGVSGIAIVIEKFVPLNQSTLVMIINVGLLILGLIFLGKGCTARTLYCSLMYSAENMLLEYLLPIKNIPGAVATELANGAMQYTLTNQPLMELVYAMLLTGIGSAILFN